MTFAFAAHRAVVDVDAELGLVRVVEIATAQDVGKAMNPLAVEGQIEGGIAQGLGLALMEEIQVVDGLVRNASFTDYLIPTVLDMPPVRARHARARRSRLAVRAARDRRAADDLLDARAWSPRCAPRPGRPLTRVPVRPDDMVGSVSRRAHLIAVARGDARARPGDRGRARLLRVHARVARRRRGDRRRADRGHRLVRGGERIDARGAYLVPGFIDAHVHLESAKLTPAEFARAVVPRGTTAVVCDPHEIANVPASRAWGGCSTPPRPAARRVRDGAVVRAGVAPSSRRAAPLGPTTCARSCATRGRSAWPR